MHSVAIGLFTKRLDSMFGPVCLDPLVLKVYDVYPFRHHTVIVHGYTLRLVVSAFYVHQGRVQNYESLIDHLMKLLK